MVYPNPQIYHHLKAIFVHVPKTTGTAIERTLRESPEQNVGGHTTALGYRRQYPVEFATYFKFAVVRHPVSRFLSAYRYLRKERVHPALHNAEIHECGTFEEWWDRMREDPEQVKRIVHFLPQRRFVCDERGDVIRDRIYRYESIEADWDDLCLRLGLAPRRLPRINDSRGVSQSELKAEALASWIEGVYAEDFVMGGYTSGKVADLAGPR